MSIINIASLEGRTVKPANPAYASMHGYTPEELRNIKKEAA